MTADVVATVATGVGVLAGVLFGAWKMLAAYELGNEAAHAALTARIDKLYELLLEWLPKAL